MLSDISSVVRCNRELLPELRAEPGNLGELDVLVGELNVKSASAQRDLHKQSEELSGLKNAVAADEAVIVQLTSRKQQLTNRTQQLQGKQTVLQDLINQLNELINNKVLARSGLDLLSNQATIDEVFEATKKTEEEAKELLVLSRANKIFNKRFAKYRQNNGGACPCCGQGMNSAVEKVYERNVKELFALSDEDNEQASLEEHKFVSAKCTSLYAAVKDLHTAMQPLKEIGLEILNIDQQIVEHSQNTTQVRKNLQISDNAVKEAERVNQGYAKLIRDLNEAKLRWETVSKRTAEFQEKKRRQSQSLMSVDLGQRSYEDLEAAQRTNSEAKDELQAKKDRLATEENNLTKRFYTVKNMLSESEKALSEAKIDGARHSELEAAITHLQRKVQEIEERKSVLNREREQLARELSEKQLVVTAARTSLAQEEDVARGKTGMIKADKDAFQKVVDSLEEVDKKFQEANLADVTQSLEDAYRNIQVKEDEARAISVNIATATAELASQEHTRRNMTANMELRTNVVELNTLRAQLHALAQEQGGADHATKQRDAERDLQRAQRQYQTLISNRDTLRGKLEIYTHQSVDLRGKLNHPTYKGIEERHRKKNIEYETTNLAISDLESYYNAL